MPTIFQIKRFFEIKELLPQDSWWIRRLKNDNGGCDNEIIAFAEGDVSFDNLNLDFIYLNIELNDETVRDRVSIILIQGNVTAKNILNEETDGAVTLMVLGNLEADNITVGGQEIYISENLIVHELFWGDYNHGELIVKGKVAAKVFMASDYHFDWKRFYKKENVEIGLLLNDDEVNGDYSRELMETAFQAECLLKEEDIEEEIYSFKDWLETAEIFNRLSENKSVLLDTIKVLPQDDIPFVFENNYLTDNNMERFRTSFLFSLFGVAATNLKELEFWKDDIYTRVSVQPDKAFSSSVYFKHAEDYAVMIFYFVYEGNLRRGIVHQSLIEGDKEWHNLDMEQPPQHLKELIEYGWKNLLKDFSAMEYYVQQFREQITVDDVNEILSLPLVKNEYSDYYNDDGKTLYIGNLSYQFRQKENEKDLCPRISVIKSVPYAEEGRGQVFYHFDILEDESGNATVKLRSQDSDGYESKVYVVSLTDTEKYRDALKYFSILKKKIFGLNNEYVENAINNDRIRFNINSDTIDIAEIKNHDEPILNTEPFEVLPVAERYQYLEPLWKNWMESIEQIVSKENQYFNLSKGISQKDVDLFTTIDGDIKIPEELVNFYKIYNVNYHPVTSVFSFLINGWNYYLLPFKNIPVEWNAIIDLQQEEAMEYSNTNSVSEKLKMNNYTNPQWIPFATGMNGDYLLYDIDPSDKGNYGQIVELQNESWQRNVVADSLEKLIQQEIDTIRSGNAGKFDFILGKNDNKK